MDPIREQIDVLTRRHFFGRAGIGLGSAALASLLAEGGAGERTPRRRGRPEQLCRPRADYRGCPISPPRPSEQFICS